MLKLHFNDARQAPLWLTEERFTIGLDARNQLVLNEPGVSAFHAEIRQEHGHYYLTDNGSQSGSFVNDERIGSRFQLRSGDHLRIGPVEMSVFDPVKERPAQASAKWFIQVLHGPREGEKFAVLDAVIIGRSDSCELCFADDPKLSRRHCELYLDEDGLAIKDLASSNGVQVNQNKIKQGLLKSGDQLELGSLKLLVIGPKVAERELPDEDATVFQRMVTPPPSKPVIKASSAQAPNPLLKAHAAAEPNPAPTKVPSWIGPALLLAFAAGAAVCWLAQ